DNARDRPRLNRAICGGPARLLVPGGREPHRALLVLKLSLIDSPHLSEARRPGTTRVEPIGRHPARPGHGYAPCTHIHRPRRVAGFRGHAWIDIAYLGWFSADQCLCRDPGPGPTASMRNPRRRHA